MKTALQGFSNLPGVSWCLEQLKSLWDWLGKVGTSVGEFFSNLFTQDAEPSAEAESLGKKVGTAIVNSLKFVFMNLTPIGLAIQAWGRSRSGSAKLVRKLARPLPTSAS